MQKPIDKGLERNKSDYKSNVEIKMMKVENILYFCFFIFLPSTKINSAKSFLDIKSANINSAKFTFLRPCICKN